MSRMGSGMPSTQRSAQPILPLLSGVGFCVFILCWIGARPPSARIKKTPSPKNYSGLLLPHSVRRLSWQREAEYRTCAQRALYRHDAPVCFDDLFYDGEPEARAVFAGIGF